MAVRCSMTTGSVLMRRGAAIPTGGRTHASPCDAQAEWSSLARALYHRRPHSRCCPPSWCTLPHPIALGVEKDRILAGRRQMGLHLKVPESRQRGRPLPRLHSIPYC